MYSGVYGHPANSLLADILTLKQHTIRRLNTYKQYDKLSRLTAIDWAVNNFSLTYNSQMSYACTYNSATQHSGSFGSTAVTGTGPTTSSIR